MNQYVYTVCMDEHMHRKMFDNERVMCMYMYVDGLGKDAFMVGENRRPFER